jgi:hypothetical protein
VKKKKTHSSSLSFLNYIMAWFVFFHLRIRKNDKRNMASLWINEKERSHYNVFYDTLYFSRIYLSTFDTHVCMIKVPFRSYKNDCFDDSNKHTSFLFYLLWKSKRDSMIPYDLYGVSLIKMNKIILNLYELNFQKSIQVSKLSFSCIFLRR